MASYCSVADVLEWLKNHNIAYISSPEEIDKIITSKSNSFTRATRRKFDLNRVTEYYDGNGSQRLILDNYPLTTVYEVKIYNANNQLIRDIKSTDSDYTSNIRVDTERGSLTLLGTPTATASWPYVISAPYFWTSSAIYFYSGKATDYDYYWRFGKGFSNIMVDYQYGYQDLPESVTEAAYKMVVIDILRKKGALDSQGASTISIAGYSQTYSPRGVTAGPYGSLIEELQQDVNAIISQWRKSRWGIV